MNMGYNAPDKPSVAGIVPSSNGPGQAAQGRRCGFLWFEATGKCLSGQQRTHRPSAQKAAGSARIDSRDSRSSGCMMAAIFEGGVAATTVSIVTAASAAGALTHNEMSSVKSGCNHCESGQTCGSECPPAGRTRRVARMIRVAGATIGAKTPILIHASLT